MKITVLSRHIGMDNYFRGVFEDYSFRLIKPDHEKIPSDCDIYVVGLPSSDLALVKGFGKPIISYPCLDDYLTMPELFKEMATIPRFRLILNDTSWATSLHKLFPDYPFYFIPYAFRDLPKWIGDERKVIVAVQKPSRIHSYTDFTVEEVLTGIPNEIHTLTPQSELYQRMLHCRALFYFSNSAWTLVFCEAMSIGIPIVTFPFHNTGALANVACGVDDIPKQLLKILNNKDLADTMSERNLQLASEVMNFNRAKKLWKQNIEELLCE